MISDLVLGPDPILSTPCAPCGSDDISHVANDIMSFCMRNKARCAGLAANQIGHSRRICAVKIGKKFKIFIDPVIIEGHGKKLSDEGCLSWPGRTFTKSRFTTVIIESRGNKRQRLNGMAAIAIQHEIDHLNGKEI